MIFTAFELSSLTVVMVVYVGTNLFDNDVDDVDTDSCRRVLAGCSMGFQ